MTRNPHLKRLLGEAVDAASIERPPPQAPPPKNDNDPAETHPVNAEAPPETQGDPAAQAPSVQELAQQWQSGEHMGVATALMFTPASYRDFVELVYVIGRNGGLELGGLLDELADSENIQPPKTPPQYSDILKRVAGAHEEEGVI